MSRDHTRQLTTFYLVDWLVIGYCLLSVAAILLLGRPLANYFDEIVFYLTMGSVAVWLSYYFDPATGPWQAFVRLLYPPIMGSFFYTATGGTMFLLYGGFLDHQVVAFEAALLGFNPTMYIDQHLLNVPANELLSFCYFSYYLMIPVFVFPVFFKKDYEILRQFTATAAMILFVSYLLFWIYPVEGPRWFFADQYLHEIEGPFFRPMINLVMNSAAVHGGAMPSSHTGLALAIMLFCFRYYRKAGWVMLPLVCGLAAGTVWGRFHYVSDVIVGIVIGLVATWFVWRRAADAEAQAGQKPTTLEESIQNVS